MLFFKLQLKQLNFNGILRFFQIPETRFYVFSDHLSKNVKVVSESLALNPSK